MKEQAFDIAKAYVRYRYQHEINRNGSSIERKILTIVDGVNEEVIQENSNKNPTILSTQRDYMAGEVSRKSQIIHYSQRYFECTRKRTDSFS